MSGKASWKVHLNLQRTSMNRHKEMEHSDLADEECPCASALCTMLYSGLGGHEIWFKGEDVRILVSIRLKEPWLAWGSELILA